MILDWGVPIVAALIGAGTCWLLARWGIGHAGERRMRVNLEGRPVPAVLGWPVVAGGFLALVFVLVVSELTNAHHSVNFGFRFFGDPDHGLRWIDPLLIASVGVLLLGLYEAGWWDDLRGDERPRGFAGHLGALSGGAVTGGMVKLAVGGLVGVAVAAMIFEGVGYVWSFVPFALAIPLGANAINLLDRAPGRALKVFIVFALPLAAVGDPLWRILAAGTIGAAIVALRFDLRAAAMLGDAGANPLGGLVGLGLAVNLGGSRTVLWALMFVLLALNLASEKWSFSEVIARNRVLARLDQLGRE